MHGCQMPLHWDTRVSVCVFQDIDFLPGFSAVYWLCISGCGFLNLHCLGSVLCTGCVFQEVDFSIFMAWVQYCVLIVDFSIFMAWVQCCVFVVDF